VSVDIHVERGGTLVQLIPLGSVRFFEEVFHRAATNLGLNWLPDVIGRAGLHVDRNNVAEVLAEVAALEERVPFVIPERDRVAAEEVLSKMKRIDPFLKDEGTTVYIG
jgi:hypothetical protein